MVSIPRWIWIIVAAVVVYMVFQNRSSLASYGPIKVIYDKIGQARDSTGSAFAAWGGLSHPSR